MEERTFFMGSFILWFLCSFLMVGVGISTNKRKKYSFALVLFNTFMSLLFSYFWFYNIAVDGVSQVYGVLLYISVALVLTLVEVAFMKGMKRRIRS
ncbi:hypothetical protein ACQKJC_18710 [Priestia koreensis]|uniref:hypothetical protein n=1 Tax=Priestia koreensis TaxID=284581 RepID=UPI003D08D255